MSSLHNKIIFVLVLVTFSLLFYSEDAEADICGSRCWDDTSCSGSDKFAGFTDSCRYPVRCCYGYVPSGCTTGKGSPPSCSPPPPPPQPPPGPTRS